MDEIYEIANIIRFLTNQRINHVMQNVILSYYKLISKNVYHVMNI